MSNKVFINGARIISEVINLIPKKNENFRILTYHSIGDNVPLDKNGIYNLDKNKFYDQMKYLYDYKIPVSPLYDNKNLSITFDDGFLNNLTTALPILDKFNFPFTIFITPSFINNNINNLYLNKEQLKEISNNKNVSIGAHGFTHRHLGNLNFDQAVDEISNSKKWLEDLIGKEISLFSYPFGNYKIETIKILKDNSFLSACTVNFGTNYNSHDKFELNRTDIFSFDNIRDFKLKINGSWDWIKFRTKRHKVQ
jgi:peptidoglycan/xylan/chitin deacetylase (PgdA/CDA1 family)